MSSSSASGCSAASSSYAVSALPAPITRKPWRESERSSTPRRGEEVPRRRQPDPREPPFAGAPVYPRAHRDLAHGLDLAGRAQRFFEHPAQFARQRRERVAQLVEELPRRGARFLLAEHLSQPARVIVVIGEHRVLDAPLAQGQEHSGSAGRSEEHTSELQSPCNLVCRLLLEKKKVAPGI